METCAGISSDSIYIATISKQVDNTWSLGYISNTVITSLGYSCACASDLCLDLVGFYCSGDICSPVSSTNSQTVPGLQTGCQIWQFVFADLECFYQQSCVQMLIDNRLYGYENVYQPLNLSHIKALDPHTLISFRSSNTFADLEPVAFINEWNEFADYELYFSECQPELCTYTLDQTLKPVALATSVLGLIGGLTVILRILVPSFIYSIYQLYILYHRRIRGENPCSSYVYLY